MSEEDFKLLIEKMVEIIKAESPIDTGNLRENAVKVEQISLDEYRIYIDESVAPYMVYTNEKWISPKWNGKENPNEKWWENALQLCFSALCDALGDDLKEIIGEEDND